MTDAPKVIFSAEVSALTGLSERALRHRRERRQEPISFLLGRRAAYYESDVLRWMEKRRADGVRRLGLSPTWEEQVAAWVERHLAEAPELTVEQRDLIRRLLGPTDEPRRITAS